MIVIKLGGSLLSSGWLLPCLDRIEHAFQGRAAVIVPGGGVFADQVRELQNKFQFNDRTAHHMALLAMQQMALLLNGIKSSYVIAENQAKLLHFIQKNQIIIWSPNIVELNHDKISASWEITSDSLAAWLANKLGADELILVKSVTIKADSDIKKLIEENIVDPAFYEFTKTAAYAIQIVHANEFLAKDFNHAS